MIRIWLPPGSNAIGDQRAGEFRRGFASFSNFVQAFFARTKTEELAQFGIKSGFLPSSRIRPGSAVGGPLTGEFVAVF